MKRLFLILTISAVFAAACTGATVAEAPESIAAGDDSAPGSTPSTPTEDTTGSSSSSTDTTTPSSESKPPPEGPAAPDFTLALEPSGELTLSQQVKPVYMILWAEW
jgi:hypothetical protein